MKERKPLLRPRVVGRPVRDQTDLADLPRDLLDDLLVVDHLVLVLRGRRQVEEQVVTLSRCCFRRHSRRKQRVEDVVDLHLDVVRLAPRLRPRAVEPRVVRRNEVRPLDDRQITLEVSALEPQRTVEAECLRSRRPEVPGCQRARSRLPEQLATIVPTVTRAGVVTVWHIPLLSQRNAPPVKPAMNLLRNAL